VLGKQLLGLHNVHASSLVERRTHAMATAEENFQAVKDFVLEKFSEFQHTRLEPCQEADLFYEMSKAERSVEDKPPRTYAHTGHRQNVVCYTTKMDEDLIDEQMQGIFIHEFGHEFCKRHPEWEGEELDWEDEADADFVVTTLFEVNLHYGDDDEIQYVELPIGSEPVEEDDMTEEEIEDALEEFREEYGDIEGPEEFEEKEESEFDLGLPTDRDFRLSAREPVEENIPGIGQVPVIDTEFEPLTEEKKESEEEEPEEPGEEKSEEEESEENEKQEVEELEES
jgi:hypothetical protein